MQEVPNCIEFCGNVDGYQDKILLGDQDPTGPGDGDSLDKHPAPILLSFLVGNHLPDEARASVGPIGYAEVAFWSVAAAILLAHERQFYGQERDPPCRAPIVALSKVANILKLVTAHSRYSSGPSTIKFSLLARFLVNLSKRPCMNDPMKNVEIWEEEAATLFECWAPATPLVQISPIRRRSSYLSMVTRPRSWLKHFSTRGYVSTRPRIVLGSLGPAIFRRHK